MALSDEQKTLIQHNLETTKMNLKEVVEGANNVVFRDNPIKLADAKKEFGAKK